MYREMVSTTISYFLRWICFRIYKTHTSGRFQRCCHVMSILGIFLLFEFQFSNDLIFMFHFLRRVHLSATKTMKRPFCHVFCHQKQVLSKRSKDRQNRASDKPFYHFSFDPLTMSQSDKTARDGRQNFPLDPLMRWCKKGTAASIEPWRNEIRKRIWS